MKKLLKDKKAITLIALVITIVVLVILAAVTISLTVGSDGLIARAIKAAKGYKDSQDDEKQGINDLYGQLLVASDGTIQNLTITQLQEIIANQTKEMSDRITALENQTLNDRLSYLEQKRFCDVTRLLHSIKTSSYENNTTYTYTATEDCIVTGQVFAKTGANNGGQTNIFINNVRVGSVYSENKSISAPCGYYLKKGDTVKFVVGANGDGTGYLDINIYGLK